MMTRCPKGAQTRGRDSQKNPLLYNAIGLPWDLQGTSRTLSRKMTIFQGGGYAWTGLEEFFLSWRKAFHAEDRDFKKYGSWSRGSGQPSVNRSGGLKRKQGPLSKLLEFFRRGVSFREKSWQCDAGFCEGGEQWACLLLRMRWNKLKILLQYRIQGTGKKSWIQNTSETQPMGLRD